MPKPPNRPRRPDPDRPAPGNPVDEIAFMVHLICPWMTPEAARNRATQLQNSLKAEALYFPELES